MKKSSPLIIVLFCIGFLLSSCSRISNMTVTKRHYRGGYYVDFGPKKQRPVKQKESEAKASDVKTTASEKTAEIAAAATSSSVKLTEKAEATPEKTTPPVSPVLISENKEEKKQAHKKESDKVYATTQDISAFKEEIQDAMLKNSIASNEDMINSLESSSSTSVPQWLLIVFAIILPPLAVGLVFGIIDKFWISCLLTLLFWIPGVIYAIYWVTKS